MRKKLFLLTLIPLLMCTGCDSGGDIVVKSLSSYEVQDSLTLLEFTGCKFEDQTFVYDGKFHQLKVEGAPEGTNIVYSKNNLQKEVGSYVITATLSKEGYIDKTLTATLTIKEGLKDFEGINFESKTIEYDGNVHSLVLTGAPEGASITYTNNEHSEVGVYSVSATVKLEGYKTKTYTATLTILGRKITGVIFESATFKYDGKPHSIYVSNLPEGTSATYVGNGKIYEGTYLVTATITGIGYENLTLTAYLTISNKKDFPDADFDNIYWIYDNRDINVKELFSSYESNLTSNFARYYDVIYKVNDVVKEEPIIKNVGTYNVSATYSASDYDSKTISVNITISDTIGGVDTSKTAYKFTNNSKFQDLYKEIKKGNYSVKATYRDEYDHNHDGIYEEVSESPYISNYYVTPEAFAGRHNENSTKYSSEDYFIVKGNDYAFNNEFSYYSYSKYKMPASSYLETVIDLSNGMIPFALLKESETGGFEDSVIGGYHDTYGSYEIDSEKNQLIVTGRTHYFHNEWDHDEVMEYVFYNIGNTKVNIPEEMKGKDSIKDLFVTGNFVENGIEYNVGENSLIANVTLNECDGAYLGGKGVYTLRPEIDGISVNSIAYDYYYSYYYVDHSKYELNVYFDDYGYYQGDYAEFGFVKYYKDASKFGTINYYGEW